MRNVVRMDGDQADSALGLERAEPLDDAAGRQAQSALPRHLDRDQIAVDGACGGVRGDRKCTAELFFVDRDEAPAAAGEAAKDAERAMLRSVDQLYDPPARFLMRSPFDANERAVADAGNFARASAARRDDMDDGGRAVDLFVPLGRPRQ